MSELFWIIFPMRDLSLADVIWTVLAVVVASVLLAIISWDVRKHRK